MGFLPARPVASGLRSSRSAGRQAIRRAVLEVLESRQLLSGSMPALAAPKYAAGDGAYQVDLLDDFANSAPAGSYAASVDWGDGTSSPGGIDQFDYLSVVMAQHTYAAAGTYPVTLTLTSQADGGQAGASVDVTVAEPAESPLESPSVVGPDAFSPGMYNGFSAESMSPETVTPAPAGPPEVMTVYVNSSAWTSAFRDADPPLTSPALTAYGYPIPTGAGQLNPLAWDNINRISVQFSEDVSVVQQDLALTGVTNASYSFSSFSYDPVNYVATWTLVGALPADKLLLNLRSSPLVGVTDADGNTLDGEWTSGTSGFPSGDTFSGGDFHFRINVLPGDAADVDPADMRVNNYDYTILRANSGQSPRGPGEGDFTG